MFTTLHQCVQIRFYFTYFFYLLDTADADETNSSAILGYKLDSTR